MVALLVANDGGHLMQLYSLADRLPLQEERLWITSRTPQSESLLQGQEVHWVGPGPTRDTKAVLSNALKARGVFRKFDITAAVSTGSSLALSVLPQARLHGVPAFYIESATRLSGPSLSGKLLRAVPGIRCYAQYDSWAIGGWSYIGSVFDGFFVQESTTPSPESLKVLVSLGTSRTYGFRRLLEKLSQVLPAQVQVTWQTGSTDTSGLDIEVRAHIPAKELHEIMATADAVIAHAGTGVALSALQAGKLPVLVPRSVQFKEHVDDHQEQIARALGDRGLAVVRTVEDLEFADVVTAASNRVINDPDRSRLTWD